MVVPLAGRWVAAAVGLRSCHGVGQHRRDPIVPRPVSSWLTRWVDRSVNWVSG